MDIAVQDRVRVRKLRHAARMTSDLRAGDERAEEVLGSRAFAAADALLQAAIEGYRPDSAGGAREAAESALREVVQAVVRALRRGVSSDEEADANEQMLDSVFPGGRPHRVPAGPPLQLAAERFRDALDQAGYQGLAESLAEPLAAYGGALESDGAEVEELDAAQLRLVKARAEADRWLRAAHAFTVYTVERDPHCGVVFDDVWPVGDLGSYEAENAALDDAGVAEPEDEVADEDPGEDDDAG